MGQSIQMLINVCTYCMSYVRTTNKNSTQHCVASDPSYLCCTQGMGLTMRLVVLSTWFYEHPHCTESDTLFLLLLTNGLIASRFG